MKIDKLGKTLATFVAFVLWTALIFQLGVTVESANPESTSIVAKVLAIGVLAVLTVFFGLVVFLPEPMQEKEKARA